MLKTKPKCTLSCINCPLSCIPLYWIIPSICIEDLMTFPVNRIICMWMPTVVCLQLHVHCTQCSHKPIRMDKKVYWYQWDDCSLMACQPALPVAADFARRALQQQPRDAWWTISLSRDEGRGRQMTNVGRAVEQASTQVMFPGHISLLFCISIVFE